MEHGEDIDPWLQQARPLMLKEMRWEWGSKTLHKIDLVKTTEATMESNLKSSAFKSTERNTVWLLQAVKLAGTGHKAWPISTHQALDSHVHVSNLMNSKNNIFLILI